MTAFACRTPNGPVNALTVDALMALADRFPGRLIQFAPIDGRDSPVVTSPASPPSAGDVTSRDARQPAPANGSATRGLLPPGAEPGVPPA